MMPRDRNDDVPETTGADSAEHIPIVIIQRVLGPIALRLFGARKLRQVARELRRAEKSQEVRAVDAEFEAFWTVYPRKEDKLHAARIFRQKKRSAGANWPAVRQRIMTKASRAHATASEDYFVPLPSNWLKGERWEDETE